MHSRGSIGKAAFVAFLCLSASGAADLRIGRASVRITPETGTPMGSSYGLTVSTGIHDDLYANSIVLEKNGLRAALVSCDLISLRPAVVERARELILKTSGIGPDRVILSATHTHCGPQMHQPFLELVGGDPMGLGNRFREQLPEFIAESVRQALSGLRPARAWAGVGHEAGISFNRRFLMKDGSVRMNPGRNNPDALRPVAGIDPDVNVVYFDSPEGAPLASHVNFAMHPAIAGGGRFSADYPGVLTGLLRRVKGDEMLAMFTMGTAGDINHIDVKSPRQLSGFAETGRVGMVLAGEVMKTWTRLESAGDAPLRAGRVTVDLPVREPLDSEVEKARAIFALYSAGKDSPPFHDVVWGWRVIETGELQGKPLRADVQVISLGDIAWVALPGEIFVDLGLAIKKASPFRFTIVNTMSASGTISYVPTRKAFNEGSYEVLSARIAPGGGEALVEAAIGLLERLKRP